MKPRKARKARLEILDVDVDLAGPDEVIAPLVEAYKRFVTDSCRAAPGRHVQLEVADDRRSVEVDGTRQQLLAELEATVQVYQIFLDRLMDGIASHALLHAAALADRDGGAILLAAPSGHGKTSLTLELTSRGFGFLGDDYAPLDLRRALVAPYPRAVALLPEGRAPLPVEFTEAARTAGVTLMGKRLLDVGEVLGEERVVREPRPLAHVLLLAGDERGAAQADTRLVVGARQTFASDLDRTFGDTHGVRILERGGEGELVLWRLELSPEAGATEALAGVLDSGRVLFAEKSWEPRPGFGGEPRAVPVSRREAAELIGRELLNRRRGGRLLAAYDGRLAALFVDLAGALRGAACWRVRMGDLGPTADLVADLVRR